MIFTPDLVNMIRQGKKSMTRRPAKDGESECRYKQGRMYAVQPGRGQPANTHITITAIRQESLGAITPKDARREGFRTTAEFTAYWIELYGTWAADLSVWVISFVPGDARDEPRLLRAATPKAPTCTARIKRPDGRWKACGRAFADNQEICKCGARRPPEINHDHGYTNIPAQAMRGEKEAVPENTMDHYAEKGRVKHKARRRTRWEEQRDRLLAVVREIRTNAHHCPDCAENLRTVERQIRSLDRKLRAA